VLSGWEGGTLSGEGGEGAGRVGRGGGGREGGREGEGGRGEGGGRGARKGVGREGGGGRGGGTSVSQADLRYLNVHLQGTVACLGQHDRWVAYVGKASPKLSALGVLALQRQDLFDTLETAVAYITV
jgi:hypothetical protein